jgi:endothelin-converting enzyme/putative endopeptidase
MIVFAESQAQTVISSKEPGINVSFFDNTVKPADNFFRFVNGTWLDKTEISDRTSWEVLMNCLKTDKDALDILKEASKPNV